MNPGRRLPGSGTIRPHHTTILGKYYVGDSTALLRSAPIRRRLGPVQLIVTSPPYPLNTKKRYGNLQGNEYLEWFESLAPTFADILSPDGSIVIEIGNAWEQGRPVQSLLHLKSLLRFAEHPKAGLRLCQQFVCYNPARLPSPAQWVSIERNRVVDSYTNVWWLAKTDRPKADNRKVLRPYSAAMKRLLQSKRYNAGKRPSAHDIDAKSFLNDNKGSVTHNFLDLSQPDDPSVRIPNVLRIANTSSNDYFSRTCRKRDLIPHPARMPVGLAAFFIEFLTAPGDLVLDPFGGSNTTGFAAELLRRRWVTFEIQPSYAEQSLIRLSDPELKGGMKHGSAPAHP